MAVDDPTEARSSIPAGILTRPGPRQMIREITWRFAYLRRVVLGEMSRVLGPLNATVPLYNVLFRLALTTEPLSQQELTLDAGLDAAGVSRLVARMQKEKLVTVKVDARDRRRRLVKLTPKGRALEESLSPLVENAVRNIVTELPETDVSFMFGLLDQAVQQAQKLEQARRRRGRRRNTTEGGGDRSSTSVED
jgi:DNA-binding MarR family transcriptional regulator